MYNTKEIFLLLMFVAGFVRVNLVSGVTYIPTGIFCGIEMLFFCKEVAVTLYGCIYNVYACSKDMYVFKFICKHLPIHKFCSQTHAYICECIRIWIYAYMFLSVLMEFKIKALS